LAKGAILATERGYDEAAGGWVPEHSWALVKLREVIAKKLNIASRVARHRARERGKEMSESRKWRCVRHIEAEK
jgi:hypothetical protein